MDINEEIAYKPVFSHKSYAYKMSIIIIILYIFGGIIVAVIGKMLIPESLDQDYNAYAQGVIQILFMLLPVLYFSRRALLPFDRVLRLKILPGNKSILLGIIGVIAIQFIASAYLIFQEALVPDSLLKAYNEFNETMREMYLQILGGSGTFDFIRSLIIGALIPAVSEELFFRGFLQRQLEEQMPAIKAIIITSLIFALLHFNPTEFIPLIGIGLFLGFLAYASDSIVLPITVHFVNNAFAVIVIYSPKLTEIEENSGEMGLGLAGLILIIGIIITLICCYLIFQISRKQEN